MPFDHKQSIKEVIRHLLYRTGTYHLLNLRRRKAGHVTEHLEADGAAQRFREIYERGAWVKQDGQKSLSGRGSEASSTRHIVTALPEALREIGCRTLLDIGCGDWNWMADVDLPCSYIGIDIVPSVIEANREHERPGVSFQLLDAISEPLPQADAVLCREVLFHLSFADAKSVLRNICRSAEWLITTTDPSIWFNSDIPTGDFRKINLQRSPYGFPAPVMQVRDDGISPGRILGFWRTADLPF